MPLIFNAPIFVDHLTPNGLLPRERKEAASAAWYFASMANQALLNVPAQVTLEGNLDQTIHLRELANSVSQLYNIKFEDWIVFMDFVEAEAKMIGLPWHWKFASWLHSGGRSHDEVTRDPEALNKS